jgi:predicted permease
MPGVTLDAARADLDAIMLRLAEVDPGPENEHRSFGRYLAENTTGGVRGTLLLLMAAALLILLIACANIASLMLARNTARASELAVRKAIGAGSLRLVRQLLTENVVIGAAGGVAGVVFAYWALRSLIAIAPEGIPRLSETSIDVTVLAFACGVTLSASLLAGLAPVALAGKIDLTLALKEGPRTSSANKPRRSFRNVLVAAQVALTVVLAFGSGLLLRSLIAAQNSNPGFDDEGILSFSLQLPSSRYESPEAVAEFYGRLLAELRALPGVTDAGAVHCPPGAGNCGDWFYSIPGQPVPAENEVPIALFNSAASGSFKVMGIPLREGREFQETDRTAGAAVAVVNEMFARTWWPNETAVGHQVKVGGPYQEGPLLEIVGVAGNVRQFGLDSEPLPEIYLPFLQRRDRRMAIGVRAANEPEELIASVRSRVASLDSGLPLNNLEMLENALGAGLARRRFITLLLTLFAGLAMALAAVGIYGLLSYWVSSREPEIAIRLALGARPGAILWWAGSRVLRLCVTGILFGALGSWAAARWLEDLVFGIPSRNPVTMAAAALAVALLGFAAGAVPAWRASRVDAARRLNSA